MVNQSGRQTRWRIPEPRGSLKPIVDAFRNRYLWLRFSVCAVATLVLWVVYSGWSPAFPFRVRQSPAYQLQARVAFKYIDNDATREAKRLARNSVLCYYRHSPVALENLRQAIRDRIFEVVSKQFEQLKPELWAEFFTNTAGQVESEQPAGANAESLKRFQTALTNDETLESVERALQTAFADFERTGLLENLEHEFGQGSMQEIFVITDTIVTARRVNVAEVRIAEVRGKLHQRLIAELAKADKVTDSEFVADRIYQWLNHKLPSTLTWDQVLTRREAEKAIEGIPDVYKEYRSGDPLVTTKPASLEADAPYSRPELQLADIDLLRAEHEAFTNSRSLAAKMMRSLSFFGMMAAAFLLMSGYLLYRERSILDDISRFATLVGLMLLSLIIAWMLTWNVESRAELIPIAMFTILVALAFSAELAILMGGLASLVFAIAHGFGLGVFVLLAATTCTASLLCRSIRSRTRLIYVGFAVAAVAGPTNIGVHYMLGQPFTVGLLVDSLWYCVSSIIAALFMTALLPFLEHWFNIQTDISLLELGDANHPLLKELVQRAPGTYNHSISVASIAEAAAKAVGANGLLCRVSAYFHDIGKMRKPEYFVENQVGGVSKHDVLVPTMSTLVIIAHVKDGAEMGRQHRLPRRVIDIIEQHHGTTLVEYFYNQAAKRTGDDAPEPEASHFRYPGPKPQTPEAAVVMLSVAAESARRALRDPGPARLESLVESIVMKRLADGQLDACSLTLAQLSVVKQSIIKSLNAMYHARIKYPETTQGA